MQYFLLVVIMVMQIAVLALASSHPGFAPTHCSNCCTFALLCFSCLRHCIGLLAFKITRIQRVYYYYYSITFITFSNNNNNIIIIIFLFISSLVFDPQRPLLTKGRGERGEGKSGVIVQAHPTTWLLSCRTPASLHVLPTLSRLV
jgi:hypothetical protein